eukprot:CAMPEP_0198249660 /NCGR_PEP_ID=MMETSP1447-20131203/1114_1 /TAXON_ID=420782 /ORGANISM="Chaetoceros dichaeta, Strain CCMP1751" /LENGTH=189 /DNA_ID=CAMNT_0043934343 /DNA_START=34 /DNA_END=603 /DNA_ORIENTATION=+
MACLAAAFRSSLRGASCLQSSTLANISPRLSISSILIDATQTRFSTVAEEQPSQKPFQYAKAEKVFQQMTPLNREEISTIGELINEKLGIEITEFDETRAVGVADGGGVEEEEAQVEIKTSFELKLTGFEAKSKIKVIKEIRAITSLGLKDAKAMVEAAPKVVLKDIKMEKAEELKLKLEKVGAKVEIL